MKWNHTFIFILQAVLRESEGARARLLTCVRVQIRVYRFKKNVLHFGYFTWNNFSRQLHPLPLEIAETVKLTEKVRKVETILL